MPKPNKQIVVIPREYFRWRARVQFIKSFPKREEAVRYARQHGYNLVVECDEGNGLQFDVLQDRSLASRGAVSSELAATGNALM